MRVAVTGQSNYRPHAKDGGKVMFPTRVCPSIRLSVHTPTRTGYTVVGMPLAFTQKDFLVLTRSSPIN